jgi:hypothetical protein
MEGVRDKWWAVGDSDCPSGPRPDKAEVISTLCVSFSPKSRTGVGVAHEPDQAHSKLRIITDSVEMAVKAGPLDRAHGRKFSPPLLHLPSANP